ncbi:hypothetical protein ABL78_5631 [Leptomonas seymouri]|uniref:Uncharacterized protein n=1 Tax=Leptomonas seymouri TaxID=5684 RepID=A0A0N0P4I0_LEPSE|nr:hypothetical protein ABL78_5631 [Leptomonas seymouri]|eukprot:KPI85319.1 hypothetical protein ABL78_5631 [Leptomonas seymouri]
MTVFDVEALPFSCNRYFLIDMLITLVVVAVCLPVFITVYASRVYTGILLGLAVIFFLKLWRFLPSHRDWVERQARKKAELLVAEWRMVRPPTQVLYTPTSMRGIVEMPTMDTVPTAGATINTSSATMINDGLPPYCYYNCPPYGNPSSAAPREAVVPPASPLPPPAAASPTSLSSIQPDERGQQSEAWGRQQQVQRRQQQQLQIPSPRYPPLPAILGVPAAESQRSVSPRRSYLSSPRRSLPPHLSLPPAAASAPAAQGFREDVQGRYMPVEDSIWCSHTPRSAPATPPRPLSSVHHLRRTPASRARRSTDSALMLRSRSPQELPYALLEHSLPASSWPAAAAQGGSQYLRDNSFQIAHHFSSYQHPHPSHHHRHRRHTSGSRSGGRDTSQRSGPILNSGESAHPSAARSPLWDDAQYAVTSRSLSPPAFLQYYG